MKSPQTGAENVEKPDCSRLLGVPMETGQSPRSTILGGDSLSAVDRDHLAVNRGACRVPPGAPMDASGSSLQMPFWAYFV